MIQHIEMFSYRTFRDILCRQVEHFAIFYAVNSNISRYILSTKSSVRCSNIRKESIRWIIALSFVEFDHQREENVTRKVFDAQFSIQKKWNDNDFTNHVFISKAMLRVFVWQAIRIFRFELNSWIVFFLFESKTWNEVTNVLIDVFVNQVRFWIELLEFSLCYSCARFSLWFVFFIDIKKFERLISFVHFIDAKRFKTTHFSINKLYFLLYILCCTLYQISSFIKTMIVSWNFQRLNVDRLFYFARDLILII